MNLFDDIKSPTLLHVKGTLFAAVALLSAVLLVYFDNRWYEIVLLVICVWSSCRFYYYLFYVLENYIGVHNGVEKNASVFSMLLRIFRRRNAPIAGKLPPESALYEKKENYDWFDSYRISVCDPQNELTPRKVCDIFLDVTPGWIYWLFHIRNVVAARFGLHATLREPIDNVKDFFRSLPLSEGDTIEMVQIDKHTSTELVAGADDWHLNFKGSLLLLNDAQQPQHRWIVLTTVVKFKHFFGRLYFLPVKPFHKMIIRSLLSRTAAVLEKNSNKTKDYQ